MNSLNISLYDIVSIDGRNYYLLDKLKIILNENIKIVGVYNKNYTTISKTEEEIIKYIIDNKCLCFIDFL
jgi:hypothetical protein